MSATLEYENTIFKVTPRNWAVFVALAGTLLWVFGHELQILVSQWESVAEYSYGYLIPVVVIFLLWQKQNELVRLQFDGSWWGVALIGVGALVYALGQLSTIQVIVQYSFLITLYGVVLSIVGIRGFRVMLVPLLILFFMIPLPQFLFAQLSSKFQLISSQIGVDIIRQFGVSVFLEGNVIDMGSYKLQVVEACSGLRYLFPLMVFGFILAYFYKTAWWKRALIFFSTIPLTIIMNSLRIGLIGVTVDRWGVQMAEGILHDFEGWMMFMLCTLILVGEMWLLTRIGRDNRPFMQVFGLEIPKPIPRNMPTTDRRLPKTFTATIVAVAIIILLSMTIEQREEIIPERQGFASFPLAVDDWKGRSDRLDQIYIDALKFTDYILNDYSDSASRRVNFYVAYYDSQKTGESAHSPRSCIPGGGWQITSLNNEAVEGVTVAGRLLQLNRTVIEKDRQKQVVYYWFQQRGRVITNEYAVKWYLFWDALTQNRTDGALVRLTSNVEPGETLAEADQRLKGFVRSVAPLLENYIPS